MKHYFDDKLLYGEKIDEQTGKHKYFGNYGCFNRKHFAKFMKDLRADLAHAGYDVKNNIKYVYTTEYGTMREYEDRKGKHIATLRPHYHLMLFVTDPTLDPKTLNDFIGKHWFYGYHGNGKNFAELRRNTFHSGMNATDNKVRLRGLANYIGKYMHKSSEYEEVIGSRIKAIAYKVAEPLLGGLTLDIIMKHRYKKDLDRYNNWKVAYKVAYKNAYSKIATFHG